MKEMQICQRSSPYYPPLKGSLLGEIRHKQKNILITYEIKVHNDIRKMVKKIPPRILLITKLIMSILQV